MTIRAAEPGDAESIASLHAANWRESYAGILPDEYLARQVEADRRSVWQERLSARDDGRETLVSVDQEGTLAGFACVYYDSDARWGAFLDNLHAGSAHRGQGHGLALIREIASRVAARNPQSGLYLWVFEKNANARDFYRRLGATEVERSDTQWHLAPGEWRLRCHWDASAVRAMADG